MKALMLLAAVGLLSGQERGAEIFRTTCAVSYCHGAEGSAGRAPRLAGTNLDARTLAGVIANGKPGGGMPAFAKQLKEPDIEAVTRYILSLPKPAGATAASMSESKGPAVPPGRALFFDAVRMGGCGRCHELGDRGTPVGPDLKKSPAERLQNLRAVPASRVVTAAPEGEDAFPAMVVEQTAARVRVYDLSSPLPVLRTFTPASVRITPANTWSHAVAAQGYTDSELAAITAYLMQ